MGIFLSILSVTLLASTSALAQRNSDLSLLSDCIRDIEQVRVDYQERMPYWFFGLDGKLREMNRGIGFLTENVRTLSSQFHDVPLSTVNRHLIRNGVEGCEQYRARFEGRARSLYFLVLSASCFTFFLVLRIMVEMLPERFLVFWRSAQR